MRLLVLAGVGALVTASLAGCSLNDNPFEAYCNEVQARQAEIGAAVSAGKDTGLINALPAFQALRDKAPEDIADEWNVVVDRVQGLSDALTSAGADPATYDRAHPPAGVDAEGRKAIDAAATRLTQPDSAQAFGAVEQQARDVCRTQLSL